MKPLSTGSEMKFATKPSRRRPAINAASPTQMASAAVVATNWSPLPATAFPTIAAERAAEAADGPVISCRELPRAA